MKGVLTEIGYVIRAKARLSTLFDFVLEKALPFLVPPRKLEAFYHRRMLALYRFVYRL